MSARRIVVALGGNALIRRGEGAEAAVQRRNVAAAASGLAELADDFELVVTHGNGPQVGLLALEAEAYTAVQAYPLDILGAESQGMIGYLLVQELQRLLPRRQIVCILTQVVVAADDPAFDEPTKPIGPAYAEQSARMLAGVRGWTIARDGGHFRRVVASPRPRAIVELESIEALVEAGAIVICCGGGGIPVVRRDGRLVGVEAVIDKDLTAALLAEELGAERLVLATDVRFVELDHGTPAARPLELTSPDALASLRFAAGSMAPKVAAASTFVGHTHGSAAIGALDELVPLAKGRTGTQIEPARELATALPWAGGLHGEFARRLGKE